MQNTSQVATPDVTMPKFGRATLHDYIKTKLNCNLSAVGARKFCGFNTLMPSKNSKPVMMHKFDVGTIKRGAGRPQKYFAGPISSLTGPTHLPPYTLVSKNSTVLHRSGKIALVTKNH